ncbi:MAG: hypothetical protein OET41_04285 [Xanthomonadales bacterium]|jgi:hypothetical protein|nr:hypothetical protein [Xanthomonadales bacterium]
MLYVLHHPKGTLMLAAQDKEQVRKWSERQLGSKALLVSISEEGSFEKDGFVEKGGTGIEARKVEGCQPVLSIMANFMERMPDAKGDHMESDHHVSVSRLKGMKPTVH